MGSGDLTTAMRASLSAPGVFAPVGARDGCWSTGIADNVPVDIARAMGVDVVIVVDVGFRSWAGRAQQRAGDLNQMLAILIRRNAQAQLATLTPKDVLIQPALGNTSSFDFGLVARGIRGGRARSARQGHAARRRLPSPNRRCRPLRPRGAARAQPRR
jgi:NTE family protein